MRYEGWGSLGFSDYEMAEFRKENNKWKVYNLGLEERITWPVQDSACKNRMGDDPGELHDFQ